MRHLRPDVSGRRRSDLLRPNCEFLEGRLALSTLSVASVVAGAASPSGSPTSFSVRFDRPLDPGSIGFDDFEIETGRPRWPGDRPSPRAARLLEGLDPTDPTGSTIALTLRSPLPVGHYQLALGPDSGLIRARMGRLRPFSSLGVGIDDFAVGTPARSSSPSGGPVDLGTVGGPLVARSGSIDLTSAAGGSATYRLTLAPGHRWRLGLAVGAKTPGPRRRRSPSPTRAVKSWRPRGSGSRATRPTPISSPGSAPGPTRSTVSDARPAGSTASTPPNFGFDLQAVADPADSPAEVLGLRLDHADPTSAEATGFTLQFSEAIATATLNAPGTPSLAVVDGSGKTWPVHSLGYDSSLGQLSVLFDQPLPAGTYSVEIPAAARWFNLAGLVPDAPGLPSGTLGRSPRPNPAWSPGDLGPIFPSETTGVSSRSRWPRAGRPRSSSPSSKRGPIRSADSAGSPGSAIRSRTPAATHFPCGCRRRQPSGAVDSVLGVGTYTLTLTNSGLTPATVPFRLVQKLANAADLILGGVSQGQARPPDREPGAGLRGRSRAGRAARPDGRCRQPGVGPPTSSVPSDSASASTPSSVSVPTPTPTPPIASPISAPTAASTLSTSVVSGARLRARPSGTAYFSRSGRWACHEQFGAARRGRPFGAGRILPASNGPGLPSGLRDVPESAIGGPIGRPDRLADEPEPRRTPRAVRSWRPASWAGPTSIRRADDRSLADSEWLASLVESGRGLGRPPAARPEPSPPPRHRPASPPEALGIGPRCRAPCRPRDRADRRRARTAPARLGSPDGRRRPAGDARLSIPSENRPGGIEPRRHGPDPDRSSPGPIGRAGSGLGSIREGTPDRSRVADPRVHNSTTHPRLNREPIRLPLAGQEPVGIASATSMNRRIAWAGIVHPSS